MRKSAAACIFNAESIIQAGNATFWTFTFDPRFSAGDMGLDHEEGAEQWDRCLRALRREYPDLSGLRVFEPHRNGRLHIHALLVRRLPIRHVKHLASRYGFGRINCVQVRHGESDGLPGYLAKYLQKTHAERHRHFRKGRRLWSTFGNLPQKSLVKNLQCDSPNARFFKWWFKAPLPVAEDFFAHIMPWHSSMTEGQVLPRISIPKLKSRGQRWHWSNQLYIAFTIWWSVSGEKKRFRFPGLGAAMQTPAWDA